MKVLILTSPQYEKFIWEFVRPFMNEHLILIHGLKGRIEDWEELNGIGYDTGISFMYTHKVPAEEVRKHKWYNFHPGPLPAYKGRNLCYHAILNGETEFGATLHYMDENFDTGPIIDVWHFEIAPHQTAESVYRDAINTAKGLFEEYFPMILEDFPFATLPNEGGDYYKKEPIDNVIPLSGYQTDLVRAIYFPPYYPKIEIGGLTYKIVRDE